MFGPKGLGFLAVKAGWSVMGEMEDRSVQWISSVWFKFV